MSGFCLGCMKPKAGAPVCEHCGFDERQGNLSHQLPLGTVLQNQYLVGRVLGQGGFGITYIGWDRNLSVPVAIKEYYPGGVVQRNTQWGMEVSCTNGKSAEAYGRYRDRFLKEARTLAQLSRIPEIVQIRSFFQENNTAYIVMEYVQGVTLKSCLNNLGRPMTEAEALEIMQPVLKALQKIHHCGVIHRDISPDNIMIHNSGIKLIDFGTVRYIDDSGHSQSTEAILKPGFAPMEQYNTRGNLGTWTDVYSICASFHYLLTGKVPPDVHERLDEGEELTLLRNRGGISGNTIKALEKGMRIRYQERLQTVDELYSLLYVPKPVKQQKQKKEKVAPTKKTAPKKRRKGIWAIAAAAVAVAAACALILQPKQTKSEPIVTFPEPVVSEEAERNTPEAIAYAEAEQLLAEGETGKAAIAFGRLGDYEDARQRSIALWREITPNRTVGGGYHVSAALKTDGTVLFAGFGDARQLEAKKWKDLISISISSNHAVGLKADGTVLAAGPNFIGQCDVSEWTDMIAVEAVHAVTVGLKSDGTVLAIGYNENGQCNVSDWKDIVAISASQHTVGLKMDGTVVAVGAKGFDKGQLNVGDWTDIIAISAGNVHTVGLKSDGTVLAAGGDYGNGVSACVTDVEGWKDIIAVTAGTDFTAGLKFDGTVVFAGFDFDQNYKVSEWTDIVAIASGAYQLFGLKSDGTLVVTGINKGKGEFNVTNWTDIKIPAPNYLNLDAQATRPGEASFDRQAQYDAAERLLAKGETAKAAIAFGKLGDYKDSRQRSFALWDEITVRDTISVVDMCGTAGLRNDGTVLLTGGGPKTHNKQFWQEMKDDVKTWTDIIAIASGNRLFGLKADGSVIAADPKDSYTEVENWQDIVSICASGNNVLGLKADGTVQIAYSGSEEDDRFAWIRELSEWTDIVAVSAGYYHAIGLRADGTVVAAGEPNAERFWTGLEQWEDIVTIGTGHSGEILGLKADGTLLAVGHYQTNGDWHESGKCDVSQWSDIVVFSVGTQQIIGVKSDGTAVSVGYNWNGCTSVSKWTDIIAVDTGGCSYGWHTVGLKSDGTMVAVGDNTYGQCRVKDWSDIKLPN